MLSFMTRNAQNRLRTLLSAKFSPFRSIHLYHLLLLLSLSVLCACLSNLPVGLCVRVRVHVFMCIPMYACVVMCMYACVVMCMRVCARVHAQTCVLSACIPGHYRAQLRALSTGTTELSNMLCNQTVRHCARSSVRSLLPTGREQGQERLSTSLVGASLSHRSFHYAAQQDIATVCSSLMPLPARLSCRDTQHSQSMQLAQLRSYSTPAVSTSDVSALLPHTKSNPGVSSALSHTRRSLCFCSPRHSPTPQRNSTPSIGDAHEYRYTPAANKAFYKAVAKLYSSLQVYDMCTPENILARTDDIFKVLPTKKNLNAFQILVRACISTGPGMPMPILEVFNRVLAMLEERLKAGTDDDSAQTQLIWILHWCANGQCVTPTLERIVHDHVDVGSYDAAMKVCSLAFSLTMLNVPRHDMATQLVEHPLVAKPSLFTPLYHQELLNVIQYNVLSGGDSNKGAQLLHALPGLDAFVNGEGHGAVWHAYVHSDYHSYAMSSCLEHCACILNPASVKV